MESKVVKQMLPMHLQFFADGNEGNEPDNPDVGSLMGGDEPDNDGGKSDKTFTQAEVTAMMTREKKEGRRALLNQLGFKTEGEAKQAVALYTTLLESQKSEDQKKLDAAAKLGDAKADAEQRAEAAENKLSCVMAGVNNDSLEDVLAIAKTKVTDEKNLDQVLVEMKKEQRYVNFFKGTESTSGGTGSEPGHGYKNEGNEKGAFGKRLADANKPAKKSSYF